MATVLSAKLYFVLLSRSSVTDLCPEFLFCSSILFFPLSLRCHALHLNQHLPPLLLGLSF